MHLQTDIRLGMVVVVYHNTMENQHYVAVKMMTFAWLMAIPFGALLSHFNGN